jgi:hypothetical protein
MFCVLVHGKRGRPSPRRLPAGFTTDIVDQMHCPIEWTLTKHALKRVPRTKPWEQ